jgi:hypothetical protein
VDFFHLTTNLFCFKIRKSDTSAERTGAIKMATMTPKHSRNLNPKKGLSEEELSAAIEGNLKPRETTGTAEQEMLGKTTETGRPIGSPLGVTTGLPIFGFWCWLFAKNEKLPMSERLTDEQITDAVRGEFPGRNSEVFNHIPGIRRNYNNGMFTKGTPPKVQSHRYIGDGKSMRDNSRHATLSDHDRSAPLNRSEIKTTDEKSRVVLSKKFANRTVIVEEVSETEVLVKLARVIPEREAWLYENPAALAAVRRGLAQIRAGEVSPGPDLEADAKLVAELED